ncbi:MAG: hypothetical protein IKR17_07735 [Bacteroidales bacterium]|nr:hypothetical protein [Bacteroidales bacterium]
MTKAPNIPTTIETATWQKPGAWRKPCIVHVTMVAYVRQPILGTLAHNGQYAYVEKTPLGHALIAQQKRMLELCPEVKILADMVMPDHHHIVLQVTRTMPRSIKEVVRGYMQGCKAEARKLGFRRNIYEEKPFYRVLTRKGQLKAMIEYVRANAERAWMRKTNPELFRLHRQATICDLTFTSLGNQFLLDWPDKQLITVSRNISEERLHQLLQAALVAANNGVVTYTAAISKGEQAIARAIREQGFPLVVLLYDGFPSEGSPHERFYKPGGVYFEACANGRLLLLEPTAEVFANARIIEATMQALRKKAEVAHQQYSPIPPASQRFRFLALNVIGQWLVDK